MSGFAHGVARLAVETRASGSAPTDIYQSDPLRWLFPAAPPGEPLAAVPVNTAGGLVGGDRLEFDVAVGPAASAFVIGQAAEKVYRSAGPDCVADIALAVAAGGWLEWLPQETIFFEGARLVRRTRADIGDDARLLAGEILIFGRRARGERLTKGLVHDAWTVSYGGRPIWHDALHLADDIDAALGDAAGFAGAGAYATHSEVAADAAARLGLARDILAELAPADAALRVAATALDHILIVRWLAWDGLALRRAYGAFWAAFRARVTRYAPALPRLWYA